MRVVRVGILLSTLPPIAALACAREPAPSTAPSAPVVSASVTPLVQEQPSATAAASTTPPPPPPSPPPVTVTAADAPPCKDPQFANKPCLTRLQGQCLFVEPSGNFKAIDCPKDERLPPLPQSACGRTEVCRGISDEGCCVGCNHVMETRIATTCAPQIESAKDCVAIKKILATKGCAK